MLFHSSFGKPFFHGACFVHRDIVILLEHYLGLLVLVKGNCNAIFTGSSFLSIVWQQFKDKPYTDV